MDHLPHALRQQPSQGAPLGPQGRAYLHDRLPVRAASHEEHSLFEEDLYRLHQVEGLTLGLRG